MTDTKHPAMIPDNARLGLFYDTETSGLPDWKVPSSEPHQPHIVQLAAQVVDLQERKILHQIDLIARPDGWDIPNEAAEVHGITTDHALAVGLPEDQVVQALMHLWQLPVDVRIGHSEKFDKRMLRIAQYRFGYDDVTLEAWKQAPGQCTGYMGRKMMQDAGVGKYPGPRIPSLRDSYEFFVGDDFDANVQHTALGDCEATRDLYFAIVDRAMRERTDVL